MKMRSVFHTVIFFLLTFCSAGLEAGENLLRNPGFEEPLQPAWDRRTPDDDDRRTYRIEGAGRSGGWTVVLENLQPAYTRLRQGDDRSIVVDQGSLLELSAWVKSEQTDDGFVQLQLYCMNAEGHILAQPTSRPIHGAFDWTEMHVRVHVPDGTAYVMAYLQIREGVGRVLFDDVELAMIRGPRPRPPAPRVGLLTDLAEDSLCLANLTTLFADGLVRISPEDAGDQLDDCERALILYERACVSAEALEAAVQVAERGGRVFMDIRNFAQWQDVDAVRQSMKAKGDSPLQAAMKAGLVVVKEGEATAGFEVSQIMPRASHPDCELLVLPKEFAMPDLEVLATAPDGAPGLVRMSVGRGAVVAADVLSLREPYCRDVDGYYKYSLITNTLTNPVQFGEYYPRKLSYAEITERARGIASHYPTVHFRDEGLASADYRVFSLNLGRADAPLYFIYAAAHGSEWEPGYGLLTFAERVAEGRMSDVIDLDKMAIKIVPILNPSGYDQRRRQNAHGVDLNRQGDHRWETFTGKDSNQNGTWSPGDYDWKGERPYSEPESQVYKAIINGAPNLYCVLDYHGNSSVKSNKVAILPVTAHEDNEFRALDLQYIANTRLAGRHLLRQNGEETCSQYLLTRIQMGSNLPYLINSSTRGRFGLLIELTAGYGDSYGTVLQTDVTCELCRALFIAYPPPKM